MQFLKRYLKTWKKVKKTTETISNAQKRKAKELTRNQSEGGVESKLQALGYLAPGKRLTMESMNEFIRLHRVELKNLHADLYKARDPGRAGTVSYLNDVLVESTAEPQGGWKPLLARITNGNDQEAQHEQIEDRA